MASIFARTIIIYILLSFSMKIMGKRQIGELDVSDLISTLLISELAAIPIDDPDIPLFNAIIPILFIATLEIIIPYLKNKYTKIKKYVEGQPEFVIFKGELIQKALKENRISVNELLCELRIQGIGDMRDVNYCYLEQNGKLSVLKKQNTTGLVAHPLIIDGELNENEMRLLKMTRNEVLSACNQTTVEEVFLLTVDDFGNTNIIIKEEI